MAWLFVPGLEGSNSDFELLSESSIALCVTSSGKHLLRPLSWRGWKTRPWIKHLSGTISHPSTAARGVATWISLLPVSRANPTRLPGAKKERKTNAGSGPRSQEPFATWAPELSSWRMCQTSLIPELSTFSGPWPKRGAIRSGTAFRLLKSAVAIDAKDSSSWPTARAADSQGSDYQRDKGQKGKERPTLSGTAKNWPTPTSFDAEMNGQIRKSDRKHGKTPLDHDTSHQLSLHQAVNLWPTPTVSAAMQGESTPDGRRGQTLLGAARSKNWPTPRSSDSFGSDPQGKMGEVSKLCGVAEFWPTPMARDTKSGKVSMATSQKNARPLNEAAEGWVPSHPGPTHQKNGSKSSALPPNSRRRLNPLFVEWLMGLPFAWTGSEPVEIASYRSWLHTHTCLLRDLL